MDLLPVQLKTSHTKSTFIGADVDEIVPIVSKEYDLMGWKDDEDDYFDSRPIQYRPWALIAPESRYHNAGLIAWRINKTRCLIDSSILKDPLVKYPRELGPIAEIAPCEYLKYTRKLRH